MSLMGMVREKVRGMQRGRARVRIEVRGFATFYVECPNALVRLRLDRGVGDRNSCWAVASCKSSKLSFAIKNTWDLGLQP